MRAWLEGRSTSFVAQTTNTQNGDLPRTASATRGLQDHLIAFRKNATLPLEMSPSTLQADC